jgi:DUF2075 family protein/nucleoid DNA-binding protein
VAEKSHVCFIILGMIIYHNDVAHFTQAVLYGEIADQLESLFKAHHISHNNPHEHVAWQNSLSVVKDVLEIGNVPDDINVSIEYQIPLTAKRIDFLLSGFDEKGHDNVVIIELKQWSDCQQTAKNDLVVAYVAGENRILAHPSYQALSYAQTIQAFNETVRDDGIGLHPCAFCHNFSEANRSHIDNDFYSDVIKDAPLFLGRPEDRKGLADFINRYIKKSDNGKALYDIDFGHIRPSKALQDVVGSMLKGNPEFVLLDDQKVAYESIIEIVKKSIEDSKKRTIVVQGGPGTGKSVIAINLLATFIKAKLNAFYVSKNAAPRNVYFEEIRRGKDKLGYVKNLFKSSGSFVDSKPNEFDVLLVDEAHRLNEHSGFYGTDGVNQVKEIINASLVSVFFLDEEQKVTLKDFGTFDEIKKQAEAVGSELHHGPDFKLSSQFRCNGSDAYIAFLDEVLGIRKTANFDLEGLNFDFEVFDDPLAMKEALAKKNGNNKARMVAGYCYNWVSRKDPNLMDIQLAGDFSAQWNFNNTSTWAIDPNSFDQVGCIHTCQGLEFDYVGVIIGQDLRYDPIKDQVIADYHKRSKDDKSLNGLGQMEDKSIADRIIRDTYKVLLTRGQKGCYVYCEDKALAQHLKDLAYKED